VGRVCRETARDWADLLIGPALDATPLPKRGHPRNSPWCAVCARSLACDTRPGGVGRTAGRSAAMGLNTGGQERSDRGIDRRQERSDGG